MANSRCILSRSNNSSNGLANNINCNLFYSALLGLVHDLFLNPGRCPRLEYLAPLGFSNREYNLIGYRILNKAPQNDEVGVQDLVLSSDVLMG